MASSCFRLPTELWGQWGRTQTSLVDSTAVITRSHSFSPGFSMLGMILVFAEPVIICPSSATFSLGLEVRSGDPAAAAPAAFGEDLEFGGDLALALLAGGGSEGAAEWRGKAGFSVF